VRAIAEEETMGMKSPNALVLIGVLGTLILGSTFFVDAYRAFLGPRNIWWTPKSMALSIEEVRDDFEIVIGGELLRDRIAERSLLAVGPDGGHHPIAGSDVRVRFNNWNRVKARFLTTTTFIGPPFGAALALLVVGLRGRGSKPGAANG